jgi:hypothetical protein
VAKNGRRRPWRRRKWTDIHDFPVRRSSSWLNFVPLWVGSVVVGAAYGAGWLDRPAQGSTAAAADIHWNEVQAVPKRKLSPEELAWERRGRVPIVVARAPRAPPDPVIIRGGSAGFTVDRVGGIEVIRGTGFSEPRRERAARGQRIYAYDGDTFVMGGRRIRIANIDAPELHPPRCAEEERLGLAAKERLQQLLGSGTVTLSGSGHDRYGRDLRFVEVNGQDVGEVMMSAGLARSYHGETRQGWC